MWRRSERVNDLLRDELSALVREELRDPRIGGLVTITRVDVSPDLRQASAFVSVLGSEEERASTLAALGRARVFLRRELAQRVRLRRTPELRFISDTSIERGQQLTDLMREAARERGEEL